MEHLPHILVNDLTHVFTTEKHDLIALDNVHLAISKGDFVSVIGPSGCGKTTLLKIIGGLLSSTKGITLIEGELPVHAQRRKDIGFVSQNPSLLPWLTVLDNIRLPTKVNVVEPVDITETPEHLADIVGLSGFSNYYPDQLSGGMKQRVAFARALAINPNLLLMDEPFGSLDDMTRISMRYELLRWWETTRQTVVFITHSILEAVLLSDRIFIMSPQPGSITKELIIDLPRPRTDDIEQSSCFIEYTREIKNIFKTFRNSNEYPNTKT